MTLQLPFHVHDLLPCCCLGVRGGGRACLLLCGWDVFRRKGARVCASIGSRKMFVGARGACAPARTVGLGGVLRSFSSAVSANRPRRSYLYMPGSNQRALEKAKTLPADGLILDLEDAVSPAAKETAREEVYAAVNGAGFGTREVMVRVNHLESPWGRDDAAKMSASTGIDALLLPKVENATEVEALERIMVDHGAREDLGIACMIETPLGVLNALSIARASPRVMALVVGTTDLAQELRANHTRDRDPFAYSLSMCVLAARAANVAVLDSVHIHLDDEDEFVHHCRQGRDFGFDGKTLIHPKQIQAANDIFGISSGDVDHARQVIEAFESATQAGHGVVTLHGKLVERMHVTEAQRVLDMAGILHNSVV